MNSITYFYFLFSKSFDTIKELEYDNNNLITLQKKFNSQINEFILKSLNKNKLIKKKEHYQFFVDSSNYFLTNHLKSRLIIYDYTFRLGKFFFIFFSFINLIYSSITTLIISISNSLSVYNISNIGPTSKNIIPCIGFPDHSFNYQLESKYPSSFIEYMLVNNLINDDSVIFSIEEYTRPSKKFFIKKTENFHDNYERIKIRKIRSIKKIFNLPITFYNSLYDYIKEYKNLNPLYFSIYFNKYTKTHLISRFLKQCDSLKLSYKCIYVLSFFDIGLEKYSNNSKFYFYNYSQNIFIPPADNIYKGILSNNFDFDLDKILQELTQHTLSIYHNNQINVNSHIPTFNKILSKINEGFKINIQKSAFFSCNEKSNLGYESIKKLNLKRTKSNILVLDLPPETFNSTLSRQFTGDFFATEFFLTEFYQEIIDIFRNKNLKIYIKPKYSIDTKNLNNFYTLILKKFKLNKIDIEIIDPYDKIDLIDNKFDLILHAPYTSTFFTLSYLSDYSFYFIPDKYLNYFKNSNKFILGSKKLNNFLK